MNFGLGRKGPLRSWCRDRSQRLYLVLVDPDVRLGEQALDLGFVGEPTHVDTRMIDTAVAAFLKIYGRPA